MSFDVGERIREFRKQAGLNQDQLAELSSLNRVTVAKYESGKVEPGAKALSRIADALEVSVDILLGRSTDEAQPPDDEAWAIRERLRRDPAYRLLFDAADNASPEHLRAAAAMLKVLASPAVPIVPYRAFCVIYGMQNGMQIKKNPAEAGLLSF